MVYFTTRSGYRSGAINTTALNPLVTVAQPEEVLDYEVGVKSDWDALGMPVRSNFALYQTAYHNAQVQVSMPNVTAAIGPVGRRPLVRAVQVAVHRVVQESVHGAVLWLGLSLTGRRISRRLFQIISNCLHEITSFSHIAIHYMSINCMI